MRVHTCPFPENQPVVSSRKSDEQPSQHAAWQRLNFVFSEQWYAARPHIAWRKIKHRRNGLFEFNNFLQSASKRRTSALSVFAITDAATACQGAGSWCKSTCNAAGHAVCHLSWVLDLPELQPGGR